MRDRVATAPHPTVESPAERPRSAVRRLLVLGAFLVALIGLLRHASAEGWLQATVFEQLLHDLGPWTVPVFIVLFGVSNALWVPGSVATLAGAALFGPVLAVPVNYLGALLGSSLGFWIARGLGGDSLDQLFRGRFASYDRYRTIIEARGFEAMLYLRIVPTPYTAVSYLAGLSPISFRAFSTATAIGIIPGSFAMSFALGTVIEELRAGDIRALWSWEIALSGALFGVALLIPKGVQRLRQRYGWFADAELSEPKDTQNVDAD